MITTQFLQKKFILSPFLKIAELVSTYLHNHGDLGLRAAEGPEQGRQLWVAFSSASH